MSNRHQFIAGLFILLITLGIGAWQFSLMQANGIQVNTLTTQTSTLAVEKSSLIEAYQDIKSDVSDERDSAAQELSLVFPIDEDLTNLTRLFDDFATKNNFSSNPFFISNISYRSAELSEDEDYLYVPVNLSFTASKKNLVKFLEYVETSGALEGEVRLMSVEDYTVNYPGEYGGTYSVSMELFAYFDSI